MLHFRHDTFQRSSTTHPPQLQIGTNRNLGVLTVTVRTAFEYADVLR